MAENEELNEKLRLSGRVEFIASLATTDDATQIERELGSVDLIRAAFDRALAEGNDVGWPSLPGFELLEELGRGGFATVYRARDLTLQREVAVKVLARTPADESASRARAREQFLAEARTLATLRHENIVPVHSVLEQDGRFALVLELVDGTSYERLVEDQGPLGAAEAAQVGSAVARALAAVHGKGLVHRDVKPANVLRERGGRPVLTDFGLGAFLGVRESGGRVSGTPLYMSPEQVRGDELDGRSDLYALGVLLYYLVSGSWPYELDEKTDVASLFDAIENGRIVPLLDRRSDLPAGFLRVVDRALANDPADRYQTAGELERDLRALGSAPEPVGSGALSTGLSRSGKSAFWRRPAALLGAAAVLILASLAIIIGSSLFSPSLSGTRADLVSLAKGRALTSGDTLRVREELQLEFESPRDAHVYVLNADENGVVRLLFPHPRSRHRNPLSGGEKHVLPAVEDDRGRVSNWWVDAKGGRERFYVVASTTPWRELESLIRSGELERPNPEVSAATLREQTRSIGLAPPREADGDTALRLVEGIVEALEQGDAGTRDQAWAKSIELESR